MKNNKTKAEKKLKEKNQRDQKESEATELGKFIDKSF